MLISDMIQQIADSHFDNKKELIEMLTILADGRLDVNIDHLKKEKETKQHVQEETAQVNLIFDLLCTDRYDREIKLTGRDRFKYMDCLNGHTTDGTSLILDVDVWDYYHEHTSEEMIHVPISWLTTYDVVSLVIEIQEWLDQMNNQQLIKELSEKRQTLVRQISHERSLNEKRLQELSALDKKLEELSLK